MRRFLSYSLSGVLGLIVACLGIYVSTGINDALGVSVTLNGTVPPDGAAPTAITHLLVLVSNSGPAAAREGTAHFEVLVDGSDRLFCSIGTVDKRFVVLQPGRQLEFSIQVPRKAAEIAGVTFMIARIGSLPVERHCSNGAAMRGGKAYRLIVNDETIQGTLDREDRLFLETCRPEHAPPCADAPTDLSVMERLR